MRNGYYKDAYGNQRWFKNGIRHREDGPAIIYKDGTKQWCVNGKQHREDGPAVITPSGTKFWFLNGENITDEVEQWFEECNLTYETMEFEDKMALKFYIRGLAT